MKRNVVSSRRFTLFKFNSDDSTDSWSHLLIMREPTIYEQASAEFSLLPKCSLQSHPPLTYVLLGNDKNVTLKFKGISFLQFCSTITLFWLCKAPNRLHPPGGRVFWCLNIARIANAVQVTLLSLSLSPKSLSKVSQKSLKSLSKVSQKSLKSRSKVSQKFLKSLSKVSTTVY